MLIDELLYTPRKELTRMFFELIAVCMESDIDFTSFSLPHKVNEISEDFNSLNLIDILEYFEYVAFNVIKAVFLKYGWNIKNLENFINIPEETENLLYPYSTFEETILSSNGISECDPEYEIYSITAKIISSYKECEDSDLFGNGFSSVIILEHPDIIAEQMSEIARLLALSYDEYVCGNKIIIPMFLLNCSTDVYMDDSYYSVQLAFIFSDIWDLYQKIKHIHDASGK